MPVLCPLGQVPKNRRSLKILTNRSLAIPTYIYFVQALDYFLATTITRRRIAPSTHTYRLLIVKDLSAAPAFPPVLAANRFVRQQQRNEIMEGFLASVKHPSGFARQSAVAEMRRAFLHECLHALFLIAGCKSAMEEAALVLHTFIERGFIGTID